MLSPAGLDAKDYGDGGLPNATSDLKMMDCGT
jgi:hypothetical protein